jgi:beta-mannosidase
LWAGNNENDQVLQWAGLHQRDPNRDRISRSVLPEAVRRHDGTRPYLPSSPYRGPAVFRAGDEQRRMPEVHLWGPRPFYKDGFYTETPAPFVSEIGYHGCPAPASLRRMLDPPFVWPWCDNDQWRTKAVRWDPRSDEGADRIDMMVRMLNYVVDPVPRNLEDFALASQIAQAEALKFFVEHWRQRDCAGGILWWNLRDGWPIISDAVADYYNRRKLAYHFIKRVQADVVVMCGEPVEGMHSILVANDTRGPASGWVRVADADSGRVLLETGFETEPGGRRVIGSVPSVTAPALWLMTWTLEDGAPGRNHYLAGPLPVSLDMAKRWLDRLDIAPEGWDR